MLPILLRATDIKVDLLQGVLSSVVLGRVDYPLHISFLALRFHVLHTVFSVYILAQRPK